MHVQCNLMWIFEHDFFFSNIVLLSLFVFPLQILLEIDSHGWHQFHLTFLQIPLVFSTSFSMHRSSYSSFWFHNKAFCSLSIFRQAIQPIEALWHAESLLCTNYALLAFGPTVLHRISFGFSVFCHFHVNDKRDKN